MNIGLSIRNQRESKKITQVEMCKACGITQTTLSLIETGRRLPHPATIVKISKYLNVCTALLYINAVELSDAPKSKGSLFKKNWPKVVKTATDLLT